MLLYLNTVGEDNGGETSFSRLARKFSPTAGTALMFANVRAGTDDESHAYVGLLDTIHEALPVKQGCVKYAINVWIHAKPQNDNVP